MSLLPTRGFVNGSTAALVLRGYVVDSDGPIPPPPPVPGGTIAQTISITLAQQDVSFTIDRQQVTFIMRDRRIGFDDG